MRVVVDHKERQRPTHCQQRPDRQQTAAKTSRPGADQSDGVGSEESTQIGQELITAMPAAAEVSVSISVVVAQNGPFIENAPIKVTLRKTTFAVVEVE